MYRISFLFLSLLPFYIPAGRTSQDTRWLIELGTLPPPKPRTIRNRLLAQCPVTLCYEDGKKEETNWLHVLSLAKRSKTIKKIVLEHENGLPEENPEIKIPLTSQELEAVVPHLYKYKEEHRRRGKKLADIFTECNGAQKLGLVQLEAESRHIIELLLSQPKKIYERAKEQPRLLARLDNALQSLNPTSRSHVIKNTCLFPFRIDEEHDPLSTFFRTCSIEDIFTIHQVVDGTAPKSLQGPAIKSFRKFPPVMQYALTLPYTKKFERQYERYGASRRKKFSYEIPEELKEFESNSIAGFYAKEICERICEQL